MIRRQVPACWYPAIGRNKITPKTPVCLMAPRRYSVTLSTQHLRESITHQTSTARPVPSRSLHPLATASARPYVQHHGLQDKTHPHETMAPREVVDPTPTRPGEVRPLKGSGLERVLIGFIRTCFGLTSQEYYNIVEAAHAKMDSTPGMPAIVSRC